jgi:hypothetical protein
MYTPNSIAAKSISFCKRDPSHRTFSINDISMHLNWWKSKPYFSRQIYNSSIDTFVMWDNWTKLTLEILESIMSPTLHYLTIMYQLYSLTTVNYILCFPWLHHLPQLNNGSTYGTPLLNKYGFYCYTRKVRLIWLPNLTIDSPRLTGVGFAPTSEVYYLPIYP